MPTTEDTVSSKNQYVLVPCRQLSIQSYFSLQSKLCYFPYTIQSITILSSSYYRIFFRHLNCRPKWKGLFSSLNAWRKRSTATESYSQFWTPSHIVLMTHGTLPSQLGTRKFVILLRELGVPNTHGAFSKHNLKLLLLRNANIIITLCMYM